ncbi:pentatricopeptide repeat-containing protein At1g33350-like isoform X1 [Papaver somniferum]|uniref:pentatricopeptide repeat-containing protein At1g33350-like isoform X1 n=1 Tax=Papaver somniferum TaxID=3469 RepID=UPI000E70579C|nr:pentatricopeptide repeat-containing protein At1g33350-like isoform X1 [Papaver somniferum]
MFAKCGDLESASLMFNQLRKKCIITWTSMVAVLAFNGQCKKALTLFEEMYVERIQPDDVIFIAVLSACTHGGLIEQGQRVFSQMVKQFYIVPRIEHYGCMIDLLSGAGKLGEAHTLSTSMSMKPNAALWATLLGFCKLYGQEMLEVVTKKILELEPSNPAYLMMVSNLNAPIGRWEDVLNVRAAMNKEGIQKVPGSSSIQVENKVHEFLVKNTKHKNRMEIFKTLDSLYDQLKTVGIMEKRENVLLGMA